MILSPSLSDYTNENSASYASGVLQNESGPQDGINIRTGLTTNAKELRDGS